MDAANVHNYRRCIMSFDISPCDVRLVFVSDLLVFFPIGLPVPCLIDACLAFAHFYSRICFAYVLQAIQTSFPLAIVKLMLLYSPIFGLSSLLAMFSPRCCQADTSLLTTIVVLLWPYSFWVVDSTVEMDRLCDFVSFAGVDWVHIMQDTLNFISILQLLICCVTFPRMYEMTGQIKRIEILFYDYRRTKCVQW